MTVPPLEKNHIQNCVVHMVRGSIKFVPYKNLKPVYSAVNVLCGHDAFEEDLRRTIDYEFVKKTLGHVFHCV